MSRPIVIAAGGTGGHMFPALALATELRLRGEQVVLMTDQRTGERARKLFAGMDVHVLPGAGIAGRGVLKAVAAVVALARGVRAAKRLLRRIDPAAVIGFGGYPSVPPVLAAKSLGSHPAILLHEQNAVMGRANRFLARRASLVALTFANTGRVPSQVETQVTGIPVRDDFNASMTHYAAPVIGTIELTVIGGSLGARVFSTVVPKAIAKLPQALLQRLHVTQQAREESVAEVSGIYDALGVAADVAPFFDDVAGILTRSHLLIGRSGAATVAEIAVMGRPSILIPLPGAIDDHQTENCRGLVTGHAAVWMPEPMFTPDLLAETLTQLFENPAKLAQMAQAAHSLARPHAAAELADAVLAEIEKVAA